MKIDVYLTPVPFTKSKVEDKTVVVIDVLRATTTICQALSVGAKAVIPTDGRGEAGEMWIKLGHETTVLAGEQNGKKIENFQLGNSPYEFTSESVKGKSIIMTTTNGTPVFKYCKNAKTVMAAGFVNISKVAGAVKPGKNLVIACSGKDGQFSIEDTLCAGMLIELLQKDESEQYLLNDAGKLAHLLYKTNHSRLEATILEGEHGRFLQTIGFTRDVSFASQIDAVPVLPLLKNGQLIIEK